MLYFKILFEYILYFFVIFKVINIVNNFLGFDFLGKVGGKMKINLID